MAASIFFRGISRKCLRVGSKGICRSPTVLSPELCRAFAVAPFRAAFGSNNLQSSQQPYQAVPSILNRVSNVQHSISRNSSSGDHVKMWTAERAVAVMLLGAIPAAIAMPTPPIEAFLALTLTVHGHWGIEALVHDYIRPAVFGEVLPRLTVAAVYALSVMTFGSLCYFIFTDVGLINAVSMFWKL